MQLAQGCRNVSSVQPWTAAEPSARIGVQASCHTAGVLGLLCCCFFCRTPDSPGSHNHKHTDRHAGSALGAHSNMPTKHQLFRDNKPDHMHAQTKRTCMLCLEDRRKLPPFFNRSMRQLLLACCARNSTQPQPPTEHCCCCQRQHWHNRGCCLSLLSSGTCLAAERTPPRP
jgi:hypothetical protein